MCLEIKLFSRRQTAKEDMVCYKVVRSEMVADLLGVKYYSSLVCGFWYRVGRKYKSKLDWGVFSIGEGFHSYVHLSDAHAECYRSDYVVIKCRIPKGAKYYKGTYTQWDVREYPSYASDTIIIDGEV